MREFLATLPVAAPKPWPERPLRQARRIAHKADVLHLSRKAYLNLTMLCGHGFLLTRTRAQKCGMSWWTARRIGRDLMKLFQSTNWVKVAAGRKYRRTVSRDGQDQYEQSTRHESLPFLEFDSVGVLY